MIRRPSRLVLLGHPVLHSLSPRFQNAALRAAGIPLVYEGLDVAPRDLEPVLRGLRADGVAGNVTIPHKERVAAICDTLTADARRAGAVNTFWVEDGRLVGDNTDIAGVRAAVRRLLGRPPEHLPVGLLGAGGAAAAVVCAAAEWPGASIAIYNRTRARAEELAARARAVSEVEVQVAASAADAVREAALVVNATSIGLHGDALPVEPEHLAPSAAVLDLVYRPGGTELVLAARALGHAADDGLAMLIEQGALSFERWLGVAPDREVMWSSVRDGSRVD
ncbi:MAG TPA: shikimate dehydrogenase [Gemmatimonadaceae bacterium]|nr:shikimate dehydrogenase [Gemmatimonadaceae bacterium]